MRGRLYPKLASLILAPLLAGGCVQATRHSNTMLFGTNTSLGIQVGTSATQVPSVVVGYHRQEAVVMPLVANTKDDGNTQKPCNLTDGARLVGENGYTVHPCSLIAIRGEAQDSYSVLASFGARFSGSSTPGEGKAGGGLAQYFATGMAAQLLALTGGASVVAVSDAAEKSAEIKPTASTVEALFGGEVQRRAGVVQRQDYDAFQPLLIDKIKSTKAENLAARITAFEGATLKDGLAENCATATAADCAKAVVDNDIYRDTYSRNKAKFDLALTAWATP